MIAIAACLALLIGWYRGFSLRSLELAAAAFVIVLALQTLGLVVTGREPGAYYWPTIAVVAVGWVAAVWAGSVARRRLHGRS